MTLDEFLRNYNGTPCDLEEIAEIAATVEDDEELSVAADTFLQVKEVLQDRLASSGFEFG